MTITVSKFWIVRGLATATGQDKAVPAGRTIDVFVGEWRGMTDDGQPAWVTSGPTHFTTAEQGLFLAKILPKAMWGFKDVRDVWAVHITRTVTVDEDEDEFVPLE